MVSMSRKGTFFPELGVTTTVVSCMSPSMALVFSTHRFPRPSTAYCSRRNRIMALPMVRYCSGVISFRENFSFKTAMASTPVTSLLSDTV